jgi:uncharacterized protein YjiS (DUF1127 family)
MLSQNENREFRSKRPPSPLREDHIVLMAIDAVLALHQAVKRYFEHHRTRRALAKLDDHLLRDIGVTRSQASRESRRWRSGPDKCHRALGNSTTTSSAI